MITVKNPQDLHDYCEGLARQFGEIEAFVYLDSGEEMDNRIQNYFNNQYKGGVALFLGMFETDETPNRRGLALATISAQLTVLKKADTTKTGELIKVRNDTWSLLLRVLGRIEMDYDEARHNFDEIGYEPTDLTAIVPARNRQLLPVTKPANVKVYGYAVDLDIRISVNDLKYDGAD